MPTTAPLRVSILYFGRGKPPDQHAYRFPAVLLDPNCRLCVAFFVALVSTRAIG
jgi:hypothetical protein